MLALSQNTGRLLETLRPDGLLDDADSLLRLTDVDGQEGFSGKIIGQVGATVIERESLGQETVADLFRPIIVLRRVLDGNMILVRAQYIPLIVERTEATAKDVYLVAIMLLQLLHELDTIQMTPGKGFVACNDGEQLGLLRHIRRMRKRVVVL